MKRLRKTALVITIGLLAIGGCATSSTQNADNDPASVTDELPKAFSFTDISELITDEYALEIEEYIPFWAQSSDGSITIHIHGPQAEPNFSAHWLPPTGDGERVLVVEEGWNGPIMELSRQWAFTIRGENGQNIFPTEIQFVRYDGLPEVTVLPTVVNGEWVDRLTE